MAKAKGGRSGGSLFPARSRSAGVNQGMPGRTGTAGVNGAQPQKPQRARPLKNKRGLPHGRNG